MQNWCRRRRQIHRITDAVRELSPRILVEGGMVDADVLGVLKEPHEARESGSETERGKTVLL
jgi:hypothetical protein